MAVDDGATEVGVGGDVDDGSGEEGFEFGGDVAAKGGVGFFVEFWGVGVGADGGGGLGGSEMAGLGVDDLDGALGVGRDEGGAFEGAGGIVSKDESGGQGNSLSEWMIFFGTELRLGWV
jgi:hypothetical protein